jgi:phosphotransferase system enzyme I (PtsP)
MVPASTCVLYLYDDAADDLVAAHTAGEHAAHFTSLRIPRGQRLTGWVAANKQSVRNSDPILDLGDSARDLRPPLRSCLGAPIFFGADTVGVLTIYSTVHDAFREDHQRIVEAVAKQIAPTLHGAIKRGREAVGVPEDHIAENSDEMEVFGRRPENVVSALLLVGRLL